MAVQECGYFREKFYDMGNARVCFQFNTDKAFSEPCFLNRF